VINFINSSSFLFKFPLNIQSKIPDRYKIITVVGAAALAVFTLFLIYCKYILSPSQVVKGVDDDLIMSPLMGSPSEEKQDPILKEEVYTHSKNSSKTLFDSPISSPSEISIEGGQSPKIIVGQIKSAGTATGLVGDVEKCRLRLNKKLTLPGGMPLLLEETDYLIQVTFDTLNGLPQHKLNKLMQKTFYIPGPIFDNCTDKIRLEYNGTLIELSLDSLFEVNREIAKKRCYLENRTPLFHGCGDLCGFEALKKIGGLPALNLSINEMEAADYRNFENSKAFKLMEDGNVEEVPCHQITWENESQQIANSYVCFDLAGRPVAIFELPGIGKISNVDIILHQEGVNVYVRNAPILPEGQERNDISKALYNNPDLLIRPSMHSLTKDLLILEDYREFFGSVPFSSFGKTYDQIKEKVTSMKWVYQDGLLYLRFPEF